LPQGKGFNLVPRLGLRRGCAGLRLGAALALLNAAPALAQADTEAAPQAVLRVETRARYEWADDANTDPASEALTIRVRPSLELAFSPQISLLGEIEAIAAVLPGQRNGFLNGTGAPAIADAEVFELNRLQIEWAPVETLSLTLGRQRISLDDERFIGTVDFRQNQQTYDAITGAWQLPGNAVLHAGYIWRVGRVLGPDRPDGVFESDSVFANLAVPVPGGQASLYHYDFDLDDRAGSRSHLRTTGISWRGRRLIGDLGLAWELAFARQAQAGRTPVFWRAGASIDRGELEFAVRLERLGNDDGTAFQTPLATLHRFQGAADLFLVTPPQGITDFEARAIWRIGSLGPARATSLALQFNRFDPATGSGRLGEEWGAELATSLAGNRLSLAASAYRADRFASDTRRLWLTISRDF
jgi:hypothetical protein